MSPIAEKITDICTAYLGPATGVFLTRQTKYHMKGLELDTIRPDQLPELLYWIKISGSLIIDEEKTGLMISRLMKELGVSELAEARTTYHG